MNTIGCGRIEQQKPLENKKLYKVEVSYTSSEDEYTDAIGREILSTRESHPTFTIEANKGAQDKLNTFYQGKIKEYEDKVNSFLEEVRQECQDPASNGDPDYVSRSSLDVSYKLERADQHIISLTQRENEYKGGAAYGHTYHYAQTFNAATGEYLKFEDIVKDKQAALNTIKTQIIKQTCEETFNKELYDNYKTELDTVLTEDTWYLSEEGLVIICNPYLICPRTTEDLRFVIPYKDCTYLKEEYKLNTEP